MNLLNMNEIVKNSRINVELAKQKGLVIDDSYNEYQLVQALYKKALDNFLMQKTSINKIDKLIKDSNLNFGIIEKENYDSYHQFSYLNSEFIYVRSFLFVEKLEQEDINMLKERVKNNEQEIDEQLLLLIEKTYKELIKDNYFRGQYKEEIVHIMYGVPLPSNSFENDTLVLRLRYGINHTDINEEDFIKNLKEKENFLNNLIKNLEKEFKEKLDCKLGIIVEG